MTDRQTRTDGDEAETQDARATEPRRKSISMHEDVPVWHDCCCCEAEPYWRAVAEEPGIDPDAGWNGDTRGT